MVQDTLRRNQIHEKVLQTPNKGYQQAALVQVKIENMLIKGLIQQIYHQAGEILSDVFLVKGMR